MNTKQTVSVPWFMLVGVILIASACSSPPEDGAEQPPHVVAAAPVAAVDETDVPPASVEVNDVIAAQSDDERLLSLAQLLASSSVENGLLMWGNQTMFGMVEAERYERLEEMSQMASTVIVGRILGPGPSREVYGDPGTDDVVTYESTEVEVVEVLAGTRDVRAGDRLIVESFRAPAKEGADTVGVLFLRHKQDADTGEFDPMALPGEADLYRLMSHQGVFVDRGDGVPINPISEVTRLIESGEQVVPLEEFIFGDNVPRDGTQPVAAQARTLTMGQLLQLIVNAGPQS